MPFRVLFIDEAEKIHKIACSKYNQILHSNVAFPKFANQTVRTVVFLGESTGRRFSLINHIDYGKLKFDLDGRVDGEFMAGGLQMAANYFQVPHPTGFDAHRWKFQKKMHDHMYRWKPSVEEYTRLIDFVLST